MAALAAVGQNIIVGKTYRLLKRIGEGSFGKIFQANKKEKEKDDNKNELYAVKINTQEHTQVFQNEVQILTKLQGLKNIPSLYAFGTEGKFNYLVMELLEQSVEELQKSYGKNMPLKIVLHLGLQMLAIIESIHLQGIIHRDIKPANFLLKTNTQGISNLYLIDFGLSTFFLDETMDKKHIPFSHQERLIGTKKYMSVNVGKNMTASRRDDLESLGYILMHMQQAEQVQAEQVQAEQVQAEQVQAEQEQEQAEQDECNIGEFIIFVKYCQGLKFDAIPNYDYLRTLLTNLNKII